MLHRQEIAAEVSLTMRQVITKKTPFTLNDPASDPTGFRFSLVPNAKRWNGWRASKRSWDVVLSMIVQALHDRRPEYESLGISLEDVTNTLDKPLSRTRRMLVDKIVADLATLSEEAENPESVG